MSDSEKLDLILSKLVETDRKLTEVDKKLAENDKKLAEVDKKLAENDKKLAEADKKLDKLDKLENDVKDIKLTLENEIRTGIVRIAEGHLDLSRKLSEATRVNDEKEMIAIRVSMLETEMRRLRQQLSQMAG